MTYFFPLNSLSFKYCHFYLLMRPILVVFKVVIPGIRTLVLVFPTKRLWKSFCYCLFIPHLECIYLVVLELGAKNKTKQQKQQRKKLYIRKLDKQLSLSIFEFIGDSLNWITKWRWLQVHIICRYLRPISVIQILPM